MRNKNQCLVAPIIVSSLLTACAATNDTTKFYTLVPMQSQTLERETASKIHSIAIENITIPRLIDRPQIVSRTGETEIKRSEYHQWGGSIVNDIEQLVSDTLGQKLQDSTFFIQTKASRTRPEYELYITINRFDGELGNEALIDMHWLLESDRDDSRTQQGVIRDSIQLTSKNYGDYVLALQQLLTKSTTSLANQLEQTSVLK